MKDELNESFIPLIRENYINVRGTAHKSKNTIHRENKDRMVKRSIYIGAAALALISGISFANSKTGKEIKYGLQIERVFSDTYNENYEFRELSNSMKYCYDAGYGMPILSAITEPFEYGTPECEDPECVTCRKNKEIRDELEAILIKNHEYIAARNNYLNLQGAIINMDSNGGMSK